MTISREQARQWLRGAGKTPQQIGDALGGPAPYVQKGSRKDAYGAVRTRSEIIGRNFRSQFERRIAERLWRRWEAGEISKPEFEKTVVLLGAVSMKPDFRYHEPPDGQLYYHEAKGFGDKRWQMQFKLWKQVGPTPYRVTYQKTGKTETYPVIPSPELIRVVLQHLIDEATP